MAVVLARALQRSNSALGSGQWTTRARAPLRLGLAGGGTDLSPYCDDHHGAVLNCTIDKYASAFLSPRSDSAVAFRAVDLAVFEECQFDALMSAPPNANSVLPLHRAVYHRICTQYNSSRPMFVTITTNVDAPAGSGLGSSSALVVALIEAFRAYLQLPLSAYEVARLAYEVERVDLGYTGGRQDHYAATFGGMNFMEFLPGNQVVVNSLRVPVDVINELESSFVICYSGRSRDSSKIIDEQQGQIVSGATRTIEAMHQLKSDAIEMKEALLSGRILDLAEILDKTWATKKAIASSISNPWLESLYAEARENGALAGKVSGAGGGGYMMFIVAPEDRLTLLSALNKKGAWASSLNLTHAGCESWRVRR